MNYGTFTNTHGETITASMSRFMTFIARLYNINNKDKWDVSWDDAHRMMRRIK